MPSTAYRDSHGITALEHLPAGQYNKTADRLAHSKGDSKMAADMKESIAQAAKVLLMENGI